MATVAELRAEATEKGIDLAGIRTKGDIEAALAVTVAEEAASEETDESSEFDGSASEDESESDETPEEEESEEPDEPVEPPIPFDERARRAGFGSGEITRMVKGGFDQEFDFSTSGDRTIPRQVREAVYAELERMIRGHSQLVEVSVPSVESQPFELPVDHGLSGPVLQELLVSIREAADADEPFPSWDEGA